MTIYEPLNPDPSLQSPTFQDKNSPANLEEVKTHLFQVHKNKIKTENIKKYKFIFLLVLTHSLVFLLSFSPKSTCIEKVSSPIPLLHKDETIVKIPVALYASFQKSSNYQSIDLYGPKKELILTNAKIIKKDLPENQTQENVAIENFDVIIPKSMGNKILSIIPQSFIALPHGIKKEKRNSSRTFKTTGKKSLNNHDPYSRPWRS